MECNYCKHTFSSKYSLNTHQRTAKYCLKIQNVTLEKEHKCFGCGKLFARIYHLQRHQQKCKANEKMLLIEEKLSQVIVERDLYKSKYDEQQKIIEEQKKSIRELQDKLENVAIQAVKRHTTSNKTEINNFIQNMPPVTDDLLTDNVKHLSIDHILKGPQGYAEYALEYPLKDRVLCSDYSRRKIKFKNEDGTLIIDPEMTTLAKKFFGSIKDKNKELIFNCTDQVKDKFGDTGVLDTVVKLMGYKADVDNCSCGEKTEFHHDFVKQVCSKTIKE